ncbi:MAG: T9SS type A sorting domain-containing protein [Bacteroidetes bacterium]|nr:T9SS type A sorting domain-containing protein [Bacteroidota bacterium]
MKKKFTLIILIGLQLFFSKNSFTQIHKPNECRADLENEKYYKQNPKAREEALSFEKYSHEFIQNHKAKATKEYIIPVVFHVFGTNFNSGTTVDDALIIDALRKLSNDFQGLTADWNSVDPNFESVKGALNITFTLAELDPEGNATTGIEYYSALSGFGNGSGYDSQIQNYAWDNYKYMNVYIMRDLYADDDYYNSGVSWYPNTSMSNSNLARVVYNGSYLATNTGENFRRIMTHEFGHWLNLKHPFSGGCSEPNDCVEDTPQTTTNSGSCNTSIEKCPGAGVPNGENFMDYSECYRMFTKGQVKRMQAALEHPARKPLWQRSNLLVTVPSALSPSLYSDKETICENILNDGSVDTVYLFLDGDKFSINSGVMTENTHYNVENLPSGFTIEIAGTSHSTAYILLTGNANNHLKADDIDNLKITFLNASLVGNDTSILKSATLIFNINFMDAYSVYYKDIEDLEINSNALLKSFSLESEPDYFILDGTSLLDYSLWYDGGDLRFKTNTRALVCDGTSKNVSDLPRGTMIGSTSNWVNGGTSSDVHNILTQTYTNWSGKQAYIGFKFDINEQTHYGWFRIKVSNNGTSYVLYDYAYNQEPGKPIYSGDRGVSYILPIENQFQENATNNGSISEPIILEVYKNPFSIASGTLTEGLHYSISNIPSGLTATITTTNDSTANIALTGIADNHTDDVANITLTFLDAAFNSGLAVDLDGNPIKLSINFITPIITSSGNKFIEKSKDDGSINNLIVLNLKDGSFSLSTGELIEGTHYEVQNLPNGLTTNIIVKNKTQLWFMLSGNAIKHSVVNSISNLTLSFLNAAFSEFTVDNILGSTIVCSINFEGNSTGVFDKKESNDITIKPNPNQGSFTIKLNSIFNRDIDIKIYNLLGQTIWTKKVINYNSTEIKINLDNINGGMYIIQVITESEILKSKIKIEP